MRSARRSPMVPFAVSMARSSGADSTTVTPVGRPGRTTSPLMSTPWRIISSRTNRPKRSSPTTPQKAVRNPRRRAAGQDPAGTADREGGFVHDALGLPERGGHLAAAHDEVGVHVAQHQEIQLDHARQTTWVIGPGDRGLAGSIANEMSGHLTDVNGVHERLGEIQLVDCREPYEWEAGRVEGAIHLPLNALMAGDMGCARSATPVAGHLPNRQTAASSPR